jgi:hypothetical protein
LLLTQIIILYFCTRDNEDAGAQFSPHTALAEIKITDDLCHYFYYKLLFHILYQGQWGRQSPAFSSRSFRRDQSTLAIASSTNYYSIFLYQGQWGRRSPAFSPCSFRRDQNQRRPWSLLLAQIIILYFCTRDSEDARAQLSHHTAFAEVKITPEAVEPVPSVGSKGRGSAVGENFGTETSYHKRARKRDFFQFDSRSKKLGKVTHTRTAIIILQALYFYVFFDSCRPSYWREYPE